jgi:cytochrome P450
MMNDGSVEGKAFPMQRARSKPLDPPPEYARLRVAEPVARVKLWGESPIWIVTRYEDVQKVLTDPRMSSDVRTPGFPNVRRGGSTPIHRASPPFLRRDPPEHTEQRGTVLPHFTARKVQDLRPEIQRLVDHLIDEILVAAVRPVDLVTALALPLPSLVICNLLGVPYEDHEFLENHMKYDDSLTMPQAEAARMHETLWEYMNDLVTAKQQNPGDDLVSQLVVEQLNEGILSREDLISIATLMLSAGRGTTAGMISLGTLTLLQHPDQLVELKEHLELVAGAVEELLRWLTVVHLVTARVATEDIEIGGQQIRAGEGVFALISSANRDEARYPNADTFDIHRGDRAHLAFGRGPHFCVGHALARVELEIVFKALLKRIPTLRLAVPIENLSFKDDELIYGLEALPVTW